MSYISPIECANKENWDLLRILLSVVEQDDDGVLYLRTSGGGDEAITLNTSLVEGDNVFLLTKEPKLVQIYTVDLAGQSKKLNLDIEFIGASITINSGNDYTNVNINYI